MQRLEAGHVIDGFRLEAPLNRGGMANFWHVTRDGEQPRTCALTIHAIEGMPLNPPAVCLFEAAYTGPSSDFWLDDFTSAGVESKVLEFVLSLGSVVPRASGVTTCPAMHYGHRCDAHLLTAEEAASGRCRWNQEAKE